MRQVASSALLLRQGFALIWSLRYVARIQSSWCDRSQRQNSVAATKFRRSDNYFHLSHGAICCSNLSRRRVAAICRIVCLWPLPFFSQKLRCNPYQSLQAGTLIFWILELTSPMQWSLSVYLLPIPDVGGNGFIREFKQIATAGVTTAAVAEKVWGEYVAAVCQILAK